MKRISELEKLYVMEVLENSFRTSKGSIFNEKLEETFSKKLNVNYSIGHVNATAALHTALLSIDIKPDDEVIVPPLTMSSTSISVLQANAIPIYADIDLKTLTICPKSIKKNLTKKTKAIISVSVYGLPPNYDQILKICRDNKLFLIEDNAECFLGKYNKKKIGCFGDFSAFSFQASKHMTCGNGGMLCCNNIDLADKARKISNLGYTTVGAKKMLIKKEEIQSPNFKRHSILGYNYRMSEINAAVALAQLERLEELVFIRKQSAKIFLDAISNFELFTPQYIPKNYECAYWTTALILKTDEPQKDWFKFRKLFRENGGDDFYGAWALSYFEPLLQKFFKSRKLKQKYTKGLCKNAEFVQPRIMQFKTNYWNLDEAKKQGQILKKTCKMF